MSQWERHGLPADVAGSTFIDVGCWEGDICVEAVRRNAESVLGIDYCPSPHLVSNLNTHSFDFIQLDILSEKALELPEFDIVHCSGVLYHVENPLSLLFRLRKLCKFDGHLFLETTQYLSNVPGPVMIFHPDNSLDDNPSNWWSPSQTCLFEMLRAAGFSDTETTFRDDPAPLHEPAIGRIGVKARATNSPHSISRKLLPRRPSYMPQSSGQGNRVGVAR